MKKTDQNILWGLIVVVLAVGVWTLSRFTAVTKPNHPNNAQTAVTRTTDTAAQSTDTDDARIIPLTTLNELTAALYDKNHSVAAYDIRPIAQYEHGHIPGSLTTETFDTQRGAQRVVLITDAGDETDNVRAIYHTLKQSRDVTMLEGGIAAWSAAGKPTVSIVTQPDFTASAKVSYVEPRDVQAMITAPSTDTVVIDTRRASDYAKGHVAGAVNIPLHELEFRYQTIPAGRPIVVYGATNLGSFRAGVVLYDLNILTARTIRGGWEAWTKYGYPVATQ